MNKEEIVNEITGLIDLLDEVCGMEQASIIERLRVLVGMV